MHQQIPKRKPVHRGALCKFTFWYIYYCHSSKPTGKETGKTHLCVLVFFLEFVDASFGYGFWIISNGIELNITDCNTKNIGED